MSFNDNRGCNEKTLPLVDAIGLTAELRLQDIDDVLLVIHCNTTVALVVSEIGEGPKFTLVGAVPPGRPLTEKLSYLKRVLGPI